MQVIAVSEKTHRSYEVGQYNNGLDCHSNYTCCLLLVLCICKKTWNQGNSLVHSGDLREHVQKVGKKRWKLRKESPHFLASNVPIVNLVLVKISLTRSHVVGCNLFLKQKLSFLVLIGLKDLEYRHFYHHVKNYTQSDYHEYPRKVAQLLVVGHCAYDQHRADE